MRLSTGRATGTDGLSDFVVVRATPAFSDRHKERLAAFLPVPGLAPGSPATVPVKALPACKTRSLFASLPSTILPPYSRCSES